MVFDFRADAMDLTCNYTLIAEGERARDESLANESMSREEREAIFDETYNQACYYDQPDQTINSGGHECNQSVFIPRVA